MHSIVNDYILTSSHLNIDSKRSAAEAVACKSAALCEDTATPACRELWSEAPSTLHSLFYTYVYKILLVKSKVTLVTLLRACQDTVLLQCAIPHTKTSPRVPNGSLPKPHESRRLCRRLPLGEPCGHLFRL